MRQIANGAHGGVVEGGGGDGGGQFFQAVSADSDVIERADPGGLLQKGPLLRDRFQKGDGKLREDDFEGQAGKSSATPDVEQASVELEVTGDVKALAKVPGDAFCGVADGGQVDFFVPTQKEVKIGKSLGGLSGREVKAKGFEELVKSRFVEHGGDFRASLALAQGFSLLQRRFARMFHVERSFELGRSLKA